MHNLKEFLETTIPMPITQKAEQTARQFSQQQETPQKAEQVYFNTLAVQAVDHYLRIMGIPTQLTASDSWNPLIRKMTDIADLWLPDLGRLECRPLLSSRDTCPVPDEVQCDRIGYIVVQIDEFNREATLLGFSKTPRAEFSAALQLQPMEDLFPYLAQLRQAEAIPTLSQWLEGMITVGWSQIDALLREPHLEFAFRTQEQGVLRAKQLHLEGESVILGVSISPQADNSMLIVATLQPPDGQPYLPASLSLQLLDSDGTPVMEAEGRAENPRLAFEFSGVEGDRFTIKLMLQDASVYEHFTI